MGLSATEARSNRGVAQPLISGHLVLAAVPQPILVIDANGNAVYANPAASQLLGQEPADAVDGRLLHRYWHHDCSAETLPDCRLLRAASTGAATEQQADRLIRANGSSFPITWSTAPLNVDVGFAVVLTFADISAAPLPTERLRMLEAGRAARRQVTRDLHDGAQHRLINLLIRLQITRDELPDGSPLADTLAAAMVEAKLAITDLRELAADGFPEVLATDGLIPTVMALTSRTVVPTTLHTRLHEQCNVGVSLDIARHAYLLISEALTNVVKHAHATRADVRLDVEADQLHIVVSDDGLGGADVGQGSGMSGMHDRVGSVGGMLVVDSRRGRGTVVAAHLPLRSDAGLQMTPCSDAFAAAEAVS
ncbi:PAS domain S-box-containing protein [Mycolicibacterium rutilum]|uniref:histidine kinase n=1 Tax=Mycolicibacterium rutilum TaxID=370526 RepID=A0A1H6IXL1_MYCRU|nr:PAS domain S-box-containing protein [Mycolicibacterium rutilum]